MDVLVEATTRYRCPHCRRSYAHRATALKHVVRCFTNPAVRACKTCRFYGHAEEDGFGFECARGIDISGAYCSTCGAPELPDGSGCDHFAKLTHYLRVQCEDHEPHPEEKS